MARPCEYQPTKHNQSVEIVVDAVSKRLFWDLKGRNPLKTGLFRIFLASSPSDNIKANVAIKLPIVMPTPPYADLTHFNNFGARCRHPRKRRSQNQSGLA